MEKGKSLHSDELTPTGETRKTSPIRTVVEVTQVMKGTPRTSTTTGSRTMVLSHTDDTVSVPVSRLARLSATAKIRIFPGHKDMDAEIRQSEKQHVNALVDDSENLTEDDLPPVSSQYTQGLPFAVGGRGMLRSATDKHLHRLVAVKSLRKEFMGSKELRRSFIREAQITAQLDHPCVIPIYSLHSDESKNLCLSMKYVKGHTFKYYLEMVDKQYAEKGVSQFNARKALFSRLELFLRVCDAIEYAHSRNILHCDLKPENIMIGEYREVYVMDWGLARPIRVPGVTRENWKCPDKITGTPRYLSPEAVSGQFCDERSDLYALGLILQETVTLMDAVPGDTREDLVLNIRDGVLAPIKHKYGILIDRSLKAIIRKATETNPGDRYSSIGDFSADIRRYLRDEMVQACPEGIIGKLLHSCRRHPGSALLIMFVMFVIAGAAMASVLIRDLTSLYRNSERDYQIGEAYVHCVLTAKDMDLVFLKQQQMLNTICHSFELFWNSGVASSSPNDLPEQGRGFPSFYTENGLFTRDQMEDAQMVSLLVPHMKDILLKEKQQASESENMSYGLTRFFFTFQNDLTAVFPCESLRFESMFLGEEKQKTLSLFAMQKTDNNNYEWTVGKINGEDVFVCKKSISASDLPSLGTVALTVPVKKMQDMLAATINGKCHYLLDKHGSIIFQTQEYNGKTVPVLQKKIAQDIVQRKYGHIEETVNSEKVLWCSNPIPSTGFIWVERIVIKKNSTL